ncbi:MAG TPA: contact-dependent growth inhibition system immunity protein [Pyrinomonadaceae bacterium]|nr:contact-dependent growth inhibition system immunity protein [Pyrinomonadaceae bacterium]
MENYSFRFPDLYQFFGGYFYQGWTTGYKWEGTSANFAAVVRHFKAVNPPQTVSRVQEQLRQLLDSGLSEEDLNDALSALGSNFYPPAENLNHRQWLERIIEILRETSTKPRVLREIQ